MINKKSVILVSVMITLLFSVTGCSSSKNTAVPDNSGGAISLSKTEGFANVKELKERAEEIVRLKVLSTETVEYGEKLFTVSKAEILKVTKGKLVKGDVIKLTQTGAIVDGQDISVSGDPIYRTDDEMILFLKKCEVPYAEDTYRSLGIDDGRFDVKDSKVIARGMNYGNESKADKKKVKKSDSIDEMGSKDINRLGFTVEEFEEKIK